MAINLIPVNYLYPLFLEDSGHYWWAISNDLLYSLLVSTTLTEYLPPEEAESGRVCILHEVQSGLLELKGTELKRQTSE